MNLSRRHLNILLFGSLLLFGAYIVRGWLHESDSSSEQKAATGSEKGTSSKAPAPVHPAPVPVPVPALGKDTIPLLERIDPLKDGIAGTWTMRDGRLLTPADKWARLQIPCLPPEEYDLEGAITRTEKDDALMLGLVYQGRQCQIILDGNAGKASWMEVKGGGHGVTPLGVTFFEGHVFAKDKPAQLQIAVRKSRLTVSVDSFRIIDYIGPRGPLFIAEHWEAPDSRTLYLGAWETVFAIDHLRVTPVQGTLRFLR